MFTEVNKVEDLEPGMLYEGKFHRCDHYGWVEHIRFTVIKEPELVVYKNLPSNWKVYFAYPIGVCGEGYDQMAVRGPIYIDDVYAIKVVDAEAFDIKLREDRPTFSEVTYKFEIAEKRGEVRKSISWMPLHEKQKARVARGLPPNEPYIPQEKTRRSIFPPHYYDARPKEANRIFLCILIWLPVLFGVIDFTPISTGVTLYNVIMIIRWLYFGED